MTTDPEQPAIEVTRALEEEAQSSAGAGQRAHLDPAQQESVVELRPDSDLGLADRQTPDDS